MKRLWQGIREIEDHIKAVVAESVDGPAPPNGKVEGVCSENGFIKYYEPFFAEWPKNADITPGQLEALLSEWFPSQDQCQSWSARRYWSWWQRLCAGDVCLTPEQAIDYQRWGTLSLLWHGALLRVALDALKERRRHKVCFHGVRLPWDFVLGFYAINEVILADDLLVVGRLEPVRQVSGVFRLEGARLKEGWLPDHSAVGSVHLTMRALLCDTQYISSVSEYAELTKERYPTARDFLGLFARIKDECGAALDRWRSGFPENSKPDKAPQPAAGDRERQEVLSWAQKKSGMRPKLIKIVEVLCKSSEPISKSRLAELVGGKVSDPLRWAKENIKYLNRELKCVGWRVRSENKKLSLCPFPPALPPITPRSSS